MVYFAITRVFDKALFFTRILDNKASQEFLTGTIYRHK